MGRLHRSLHLAGEFPKENAMNRVMVFCVLLLVIGAPSLRAADVKAEEAAIRAEIASGYQKHTDDAIQWTGPLKRPAIFPDKGEEFPGHEYSKRINPKYTTDVQRIDVAASGDLAYEFSYGNVEYDLAGPPQTHRAFKTGVLRVWKKIDGQWKVAAMFARPLDTPIGEPPAKESSK
jgi:ketosteroid isomerase-like protein